MAMVKRAGPISNITGKSGGIIHREDQCGPHIQAYPRLVDKEASVKQKTRQKAFQKLLRHLRKFTPAQADAWQWYANGHPKKNKKGETKTLTWWQGFIGYNINRCVAGEPVVYWPPWY
ncbi:hypothetical protein ES703_101099 [subsurface metagenome]